MGAKFPDGSATTTEAIRGAIQIVKRASRTTARWRVYMFDMLCAANGIEHRRPSILGSNGRVEGDRSALPLRYPRSAQSTSRFPDGLDFAKRLETLRGLTLRAHLQSPDDVAKSFQTRPASRYRGPEHFS